MEIGRTWKDSDQGTVIEVKKREDGFFDLFLNRRLDQEQLDEGRLLEVLCVRFGYCGEEFSEVLNELKQSGSAERHPAE